MFGPEDWAGHAAVARDDETVTIVADEALSSDVAVDWDKEAQGPEALRAGIARAFRVGAADLKESGHGVPGRVRSPRP